MKDEFISTMDAAHISSGLGRPGGERRAWGTIEPSIEFDKDSPRQRRPANGLDQRFAGRRANSLRQDELSNGRARRVRCIGNTH